MPFIDELSEQGPIELLARARDGRAPVLKVAGVHTGQYRPVILCRFFSVSRRPVKASGKAWLHRVPPCLGPNLGPKLRAPHLSSSGRGYLNIALIACQNARPSRC